MERKREMETGTDGPVVFSSHQKSLWGPFFRASAPIREVKSAHLGLEAHDSREHGGGPTCGCEEGVGGPQGGNQTRVTHPSFSQHCIIFQTYKNLEEFQRTAIFPPAIITEALLPLFYYTSVRLTTPPAVHLIF